MPTPGRRSPRRTRRTICSVVAIGLATSCGSSDPSGSGRYSDDDWSAGIDVRVDGEQQSIESATVFKPEGRSWFSTRLRQLGEHELAVFQPGDEWFDAIILYRTGPACGVPPEISTRGDAIRLDVEITSLEQGECAAVEYVEAVGLNVAASFDGATIEATHASRRTERG